MVMAQKHTIEGGEVMKATMYPQKYDKARTFSYINDPSCPRSWKVKTVQLTLQNVCRDLVTAGNLIPRPKPGYGKLWI